MSREKNLVKNTFIISLGTLFPKVLTVLITPILTAQLTKAEYGQYDLILTIASFLMPIATLQISSAAFRFLINKRKEQTECISVISTIYLFVAFVSILIGVLFVSISFYRFGAIGTVVSIYFIFDILLITTQQVFRGLGKNLYYSISVILQSITSLALIALLTGVLFGRNYGISGVMIALMISRIVPTAFLFLIGGIHRYIKRGAASRDLLKELLKYSWPMVPNNLAIWALNLSDRFVISAVLGIEAEAIYAVANKMPVIFSSFQSTFTMAWQENASLALEDNDKDNYYSKMCDWIYRLLIGLMAFLITATPILWKILIRGDYSEGYAQVPVLYLGIMFNCLSSTIGGIYIAHMKTKSVGLTTMCAAILNLLIDVSLVNVIGIWAGSISTLVSFFSLWLFRMIDVRRFQKLTFDFRMIISGLVLLAVMCCMSFINNIATNCANIILCIIAILLYDRDIIKGFVLSILSKKAK